LIPASPVDPLQNDAACGTDGYKLVQLVSGDYSVHSIAESETFHPVIGPKAEAEALYVRQLQLPARMAAHQGEFILWDVGLGAAANVLTVLHCTREAKCPLRIISFDHSAEPLLFALKNKEALGYFDGYENACETLLKEGLVRFTDAGREIRWEFHKADFPSLIENTSAGDSIFTAPDAILFDAFSPKKNAAMWTQPLFQKIFERLDPSRPCALPTYSRSTLLRVSLLLAGFYVGAGHATGEKEETTIAANSLSLIQEPLDATWLKRARNSTSAEPLWTPVYQQAPLSDKTWAALQKHPQFQ